MTEARFNQPPELNRTLPEGTPCLICTMLAKGDQVAGSRDVWEPLLATDEPERWIEYPEKTARPIREACGAGLTEYLPGMLVPVCWDHLSALAPHDPRAMCGWCGGSGRKKGAESAPGLFIPTNGSRTKAGGN